MDHSSGEFAYYLSQIGITQAVFGWLAVAVSVATATRVYFYLHKIVKRASLEIRVMGEASLPDWIYSLSIGFVEIAMVVMNILFALQPVLEHIFSLLSMIVSVGGMVAAWAYAHKAGTVSAIAIKAWRDSSDLAAARAREAVSR